MARQIMALLVYALGVNRNDAGRSERAAFEPAAPARGDGAATTARAEDPFA